MTKLKTFALSALGFVFAIAALGVFASVGLVVLGFAAILGLTLAAAAWLSSTASDTPAPSTQDA